MKARNLHRAAVAIVAASLTALPQQSWACSVCFGDPKSAQAQGVTCAVLGMIGITAVVLGGFVALIVAINLRARRQRALLTAVTEGTQH